MIPSDTGSAGTRFDKESLRQAVLDRPLRHMPALPGRKNDLKAAILVPVRMDPEPHCILTLRPHRMRQHGGEVCFPGGRPEPQDLNLSQTALREAKEEIGIEQVEVLGRLSSVPLYTSDYRLTPFVAWVTDRQVSPNQGEVERVLELSLSSIFGQRYIDALTWMWGERQWLSPVFEVDGERVFGGTAHVLLELLRVIAPLWGRPVPCLRTGALQWSDLLKADVAP